DVVDLHVLDGLAQMLLFETKQSKPAHDHVPHSTGTLSARSGPVAVVVTRHSHTNTLAACMADELLTVAMLIKHGCDVEVLIPTDSGPPDLGLDLRLRRS